MCSFQLSSNSGANTKKNNEEIERCQLFNNNIREFKEAIEGNNDNLSIHTC